MVMTTLSGSVQHIIAVITGIGMVAHTVLRPFVAFPKPIDGRSVVSDNRKAHTVTPYHFHDVSFPEQYARPVSSEETRTDSVTSCGRASEINKYTIRAISP